MLIRSLASCGQFIAGDGTRLRELLHGSKDQLALRYSLAEARLSAGETSQWHRLKTSEVYYILSGRGRMEIDRESCEVSAGDAVYIPPHAAQRISNTGREDLTFLCIVDPAWRPEDEEIIPSK
jgi:mannose-6-phosphate isomerase-like protein (cupin superfamily)